MKSRHLFNIVTPLLVMAAFGIGAPSNAQFIGPTLYLSSADSPFNSTYFTYFHLETFESGVLSVPGVTPSAGIFAAPSGFTDSVDADDGAIDGSGIGGDSFFTADGAAGITWTFNAGALGALPDHAGIVWTDGFNSIHFEAFDQNGISLGTLSGSHADSDFTGSTAEDRFYGIVHQGGISAIKLSTDGGGLEMDHLQYGLTDTSQATPEPGSFALLCGLGISGGVLAVRRRRR